MTERRPYPSNRQRVEDYYGVHDTGMAARPAPQRPAPPNGPQGVPNRPVPPQDNGEPVEAQFVEVPTRRPGGPAEVSSADAAPAAPPFEPFGRGNDGVSAEPQRGKPDPLTDPLSSETFHGVQPESDTFGAGPTAKFGYSTAGSSGQSQPAASVSDHDSGFDSNYEQFAPPRFEPRADGNWSDDDIVVEPVHDGVGDADSYIDVEIVDVEIVETVTATVDPVAAPTTRTDDRGDDASDEHIVAESVEDVVDPVADSEAAREPAAPEVDADAASDADAEPEAPARPTFPEPLALDPYPYTQIDESYIDPATLSQPKEPGAMTDFNDSLKEAMNIDGALGVALVDADSGMALATAGDPSGFNLEVAAAGNSGLVKAMGRTLGDLDMDDHIEDILITLGAQYQIVRPIRQGTDDLFLYLVLDRTRANLAMARFRLTKLAENIEV